MKTSEPAAALTLRGVPASPGIAIGRVFLFSDKTPVVEREQLSAAEVPREIERLRQAVQRAKQEIEQDHAIAQEQGGEDAARIFEVHHLILDDADFLARLENEIATNTVNAAFAFQHLMHEYVSQLLTHSTLFSHRDTDFQDVERRVLRHLQGDQGGYLSKLASGAIVIAEDLPPSLAVLLNRHNIRGFATDFGGVTSHGVILARSNGLPAVLGLREITKLCKSGDRAILDGDEGLVLLNPDEATLNRYQKRQARQLEARSRLGHLRNLPARTRDGRNIELAANLEFADEVGLVHENGAQGIGLFRTEYLYLDKPEAPSEELQFETYYRIAQEARPHPVIIRTLDLGGDKLPACIKSASEPNPFLGWRAIRICLDQPELFKTQLRAMLRANVLGNIKILLPMIAGVDELDRALALIEQAKRELAKAKKPFAPDTEVGVMIEVPAAALMADQIAERVSFLSIGTNDLTQYVMAADRGNARVAHLLMGLQPAVLRLIQQVIHAAHRRGVWVGVCGEMAADQLATLLLVGMEIDELSVNPIEVPRIKKIIRSITFQEAREVVQQVMEFATAREIHDYLKPYLRHRFKDLFA
ncbi:MAG: phosphoenolpyruvate--protein phosphotransferase [candidate division KSB1 bacterium]|nr:phosphoenolpyruvate--protein phosphotransferase [candidate division KSB1 bacterium]MDZ7272591.1 phosphoenolpyruvate--protein phosphotransferase [candidate division KSB1 bacterium]MDZ7284386.1 phosphoenolpyruvate--protein phosphotransferase [candidate division KSB1 bacterium]MDZ7297218.1 phosphoenolpyruvate--protein phosphotransferase [candidate division KSB1 bacterium]MDZ7309574.1 phosphoenolpyruvate--protein phosphotransferase [candidate division KSB1 bacterium]